MFYCYFDFHTSREQPLKQQSVETTTQNQRKQPQRINANNHKESTETATKNQRKQPQRKTETTTKNQKEHLRLVKGYLLRLFAVLSKV